MSARMSDTIRGYLGILQAFAFLAAVALTVIALSTGVVNGLAVLAILAWALFLHLVSIEEDDR